MAKTTGSDGFISRSLNKQNIILILSLLTLGLSYLAEVASPDVRRDWSVRCCGRSFWWSPVGCTLVLVGAAVTFRVRSRWYWISAALLSIYVSYYLLYEAAESWTYYYSLDKMQAFREAFLVPLYRPLSGFVGLYILIVSIARIVRASKRTRSLTNV
jgi:hypothetical protein